MTASALLRYRRRLIRKKFLWRAYRKRKELKQISDRGTVTRSGQILCFSTLRNELMRLPYFLEHYRRLGVRQFYIVDNGSDDGTVEFLERQNDVNLWQTSASYRRSRFGVDWLNWLKTRYAHGHWVVVADADELLIYPDWDKRPLPELTRYMQSRQQKSLQTIMLDMYPKGSPDDQSYSSGRDPMEVLNCFDAHGYWVQRQPKLDNLWLQGGPRARVFFKDTPERAPTLNKLPLVFWQRGYAFVNSTHSALPSHLNLPRCGDVSGVLLHTKFLPGTAERALIEKHRDEHFQAGTRYRDYYDRLATSPDLSDENSTIYEGWQQILDLGLMSRGDW